MKKTATTNAMTSKTNSETANSKNQIKFKSTSVSHNHRKEVEDITINIDVDIDVNADTIDTNGYVETGLKLERLKIPTFRLKDYAYQRNNEIHLHFKYVTVLYDQMCQCVYNEFEEPLYEPVDCLDSAHDHGNAQTSYHQASAAAASAGASAAATVDGSQGLVNYDAETFKTMLTDIRYEFDSDSNSSSKTIVNRLFNVLNSWYRRVKRIRLNTDSIYSTKLSDYNGEILGNMAEDLKCLTNDPRFSRDQFLNLTHLVTEFTVVIEGKYHELSEIGVNLAYSNFLIYKFLQDYYRGCGIYLTSHPVKPSQLPMVSKGEPCYETAFCHMYMFPLNLKASYFDWDREQRNAK